MSQNAPTHLQLRGNKCSSRWTGGGKYTPIDTTLDAPEKLNGTVVHDEHTPLSTTMMTVVHDEHTPQNTT
jgi:hypothetical protein